MWRLDIDLSRRDKQRRALYKTLRNELDYALIRYGIIDAWYRIKKAGQEYKFPEKRELKPRSKITEIENEFIEGFIILFCEEAIPSELKKYIRHFDDNKVTKENLPEMVLSSGKISPDLLKIQRSYEQNQFLDLIKALLPVDYALLIQQDNKAKSRTRYSLTHFHVRIDWLIDFAAESLGKQLRYISKDLYEKGEAYAANMVEKLFEYFSFHHTASGRRTAAIVAYQLLSESNFISTVYVNSSESRALTKLSEEGITKFCLVKLPKEIVEELESGDKYSVKNFRNDYLIDEMADGSGVALFRVIYTKNEHSTPPPDGKLRELQPDVNWLKVSHQSIMPKPMAMDQAPIPYSIIYDQQDPLAG